MSIDRFIAFIRDLNQTNDFIPLHAPVFLGNEKKYLLETIDSTFVSSVGAFVDKAEEMMREISQTKKAVAVVNGTSGLHIALKLVGVKPNEEVLTQALTFVATANAITYTGASPIFIDVDNDTMGLSPMAVESFLEQNAEIRGQKCYNKKTKKRIAACVPMHTFGFPCRIEALATICNQWHIPIVEDAAEALGSKIGGRAVGSFGDLGVYSFNGNKIVTSGGGGMIVSNNEDFGKRAKHLTTTSKVPHPYEYFHDAVGYNYRMPNLNAALLCAQLEKLPLFLENKRNMAERYASFFAQQGIVFRTEIENTQANYWLMCIELENRQARDKFLKSTNDAGVMTRPIWELMNRLPMFEVCQTDGLENSRWLVDRVVNIPSSVSV